MVAVVGTSGTTNAGIIDDLAGVADRRRAAVAPRRRRLRGGGAAPRRCGIRRHRTADSSSSTRTSGCSLLSIARPDLPLPQLARAVHTQEASYLDVIHTATASGTPPTTHFISPGGRAAWPYGSRWPSTASRPTRMPSRLLAAGPGDRGDPPTDHLELIREPDLAVVLFRRVGWGPEKYAAWAERLLDDSRVHPAVPGRARPWPGSPLCTRTPRWTWSARSSTAPADAAFVGGRSTHASSAVRVLQRRGSMTFRV